jgi:molybdopterin molybdotransferase
MSLIQVHEALAIILSRIHPKGLEKIPIGEALGRVLGEDITARRPNPPMDNSAMDGYALVADDVRDATPDRPVKLTVTEDLPAGKTATAELQRGQAMRIMTGAPIPHGATAVIMQEDTERQGNVVLVKDKADAGENIRRAGEDVQTGEIVIRKGAVLRPSHIGMLAVVGRSSVYVGQKPTVAVIATGDEIVELDSIPTGSCIYNSNGHMLTAQALSAGGQPRYLGIARDTEADLMDKFRWALECDLVISSGGVSVGDYDLVKASLKKMGQDMLFWKVAMKPGKPLAFGSIDGTPIFGLPGNPVSSFVSFEQFVRPAIRKMLGDTTPALRTVTARLTQTIRKKPGRLHFLSSHVAWSNGEFTVTPAEEQGSGILKSAMNANALVVFPINDTEIRAGETVTAQLLE